MVRSKHSPSQLPAKEERKPNDDDAIREIVENHQQLVNQQVIQIFVEHGKTDELHHFLNSVVSYNERRLEILRDHAARHPDAIESRNGKTWRRKQYVVLLLLAVVLLLCVPFVSLPAAGSLV